jgi:signal transduction histidine kinase
MVAVRSGLERDVVGNGASLLVATYAAASIAVALRPNPPVTTYAGASPLAAAVDVAAGVGLVLAGGVLVRQPERRGSGRLALVLAVLWFAPDWVGYEGGPVLLRNVAAVAALLFVPVLAHLALAQPEGRLSGRWTRIIVAAAYGITACLAVAWGLVYDPFRDLQCWRDCSASVLVIRADPARADVLRDAGLVWSLAITALLAAACCRRLGAATRARRRALWPVLAPVAFLALALAASSAALLQDAAGEDPTARQFAVLFLLRGVACMSLAAGLAWSAGRDRRVRAAVAGLARDLGTAPARGSLAVALARVLDDPDVRVAYWLPASGRYVDAAGRPVELRTSDGRTTTAIVRSGEPVAVVEHDAAPAHVGVLERQIGAAARLAVDNERLRAVILAQVEDLRASRARIVEAGDAARRRLERDLHDGAQQRLLAVSFSLRLARSAVAAVGDQSMMTAVGAAVDESQAALEELRDLAHGIYPAILSEAGLGPALRAVAVDAPLPVELAALVDERLPAPVERAAYVVVAGTVATIAQAGASHATVTVEHHADELVVAVEPVVARPADDLVVRVGALGGSLTLEDRVVRAVLPCG